MQKNWEQAFGFWDNCMWISCVKLSLLKTEYLSSAVNVLTNTYKVVYIAKRDFFQHNYVLNDH